MAPVGPELPPHLLVKRKREDELDPEADAANDVSHLTHTGSDDGNKRARVIGPALPPAALSKRPTKGPEVTRHGAAPAALPVDHDEDENEDDYGPALPNRDQATTPASDVNTEESEWPVRRDPSPKRAQRDEWMLLPPKQDDLAARMDPTKTRARGFATRKGAGASKPEDRQSAIWTETPEQKRKRLEDEQMGRAKPESSSNRGGQTSSRKALEDPETARWIKEHTDKTRGTSLYERHQRSAAPKEAEDDPSKRAFDREKDIASGAKIGRAQRKQMLSKASDFNSKFSGGSYL